MLAPYPTKYKPPIFEKYYRVEGNAREYVVRYIDALGTFASNCDLRLREFSKSLSSHAYKWYHALKLDSVKTWDEMVSLFIGKYKMEGHQHTMMDLALVV